MALDSEIIEEVLGKPDRARQMAEIALNAGRGAQSPQTGFFHYFHNRADFPHADTIPIVENVYYALGLMRDRSKEGLQEGKRLLERVLSFQNVAQDERKGLFPVYLHEYPECRDLFINAQLLPAFYWILVEFGTVLGSALKSRTEQAAQAMLEQTKELQALAKLPFGLAIKIAGAQAGFGTLWNAAELEARGRHTLESLRQVAEAPDFLDWFIPEVIADTFIALQMAYKQLADSPWVRFGSWLANVWNAATCSYAGPALSEQQDKSEPETTLYDLFMGYYTGKLSYRALLNKPLAVRGALVHASADRLGAPPLPLTAEGHAAGRAWHIHQGENYAFALLTKSKEHNANPGYCPLKVIWGDQNSTHTLVCAGGNAEEIRYQIKENGVDLYFTLPEEVPTEARQKNREIMFFADKHEGLDIKISEDKAGTAFPLGETIILRAKNQSFSLKFCLESGQGRFFGHIAQGNRPGQLGAFGAERFAAFDWQIFLRTLERAPACCIRVEVRFLCP